jgi:NitT/TauT family transport system ATP-binding protein
MKRNLKVVSSRGRPETRRNVLEISDLEKIFHADTGYLTVLKDISFSVEKGELICIIGRSGCGKTTLLNILAGFLPASKGRILLNGRPISTPGPDRCVVFQDHALFPWLTVRENIAFGTRRRGFTKKQVRTEVDRYLTLMGLNEFAGYLPREISGGMKQRVALARVLILNPEVLLMDEPFAALDAQTREDMQTLLLSLRKDFSNTILFVTHDVQEALTLSDRVLLMERGPGRIRENIPVTLPRPRIRDSQAFLACYRRLLAALKDG